MLQVAIANPANRTIPALRLRRGAIVLGAVIGAHLVLLALALTARDRAVERTVEPRVITAMLLSPEPERSTPATPAAPAEVVAPTMPKMPSIPRPVVRAKPLAQPHAQPQPRNTTTPAPTASPTPLPPAESTTPSATAQPSPAPATPSPAAPMTAPAPATTSAPSTATERTTSTAPKTVSHVDCSIPKPDYPDISKRRGESGTAIVRFVVGLSGGIDTMQVQKSSGYPRLDDAALAAVRAGVCQPYSENGTVVRAAYSQSFVFGLAD